MFLKGNGNQLIKFELWKCNDESNRNGKAVPKNICKGGDKLNQSEENHKEYD